MRNYSCLLIAGVFFALFFVSCSVEEMDDITFESDQTLSSKSESYSKKGKSKIEICHYNKGTNSYERISISGNGESGHENHKNDILVLDADGDGFPAENECGINFREDGLWDCDDSNAVLNPECVWYLDADNDKFAVSSIQSCDSPGEGYTLEEMPMTDCDDSNAVLNPECVWYLDADNDKFAVSSIQSCDSPGEGYTLEEMPMTDLDDSDMRIQDEADCFSHIVGHYYSSTYHGSNLFELDIDISTENDKYYINGTLTETKHDGTIKEHTLSLNIHSVIEMYSKNYSFKYDGSYPINSGSGYYRCETINLLIGLSGSGIPSVQVFSAVKTK